MVCRLPIVTEPVAGETTVSRNPPIERSAFVSNMTSTDCLYRAKATRTHTVRGWHNRCSNVVCMGVHGSDLVFKFLTSIQMQLEVAL